MPWVFLSTVRSTYTDSPLARNWVIAWERAVNAEPIPPLPGGLSPPGCAADSPWASVVCDRNIGRTRPPRRSLCAVWTSGEKAAISI